MAFLILCWFVVTIIYIVVRATKSLHLGKATAYGVWVLVMEVPLLPLCLGHHYGCSYSSQPFDPVHSTTLWLRLQQSISQISQIKY